MEKHCRIFGNILKKKSSKALQQISTKPWKIFKIIAQNFYRILEKFGKIIYRAFEKKKKKKQCRGKSLTTYNY